MVKKRSAIDKLLSRNKQEESEPIRRIQPSIAEPRQYAPDEVNKYGEYIKIGGSPMPGITLRQILREKHWIAKISMSPDGRLLASGSTNGIICIWDIDTGKCIHTLTGHTNTIYCLEWSPAGETLASSSADGTVRLWHKPKINQSSDTFMHHNGHVHSLAWSPNKKQLVFGDDYGNIFIRDAENLDIQYSKYRITEKTINQVTWSHKKDIIASGSENGKILLFDSNLNLLSTLSSPKGYVCLHWSPNGELLASGHANGIILIWNINTSRKDSSLEGHTGGVKSVAFSADGQLLVTKSRDGTVKVWQCSTGEPKGEILERTNEVNPPGVNFDVNAPVLATLGQSDTMIRIWDIDYNLLIDTATTAELIRYTTAKLVLVGDSGVGKTGLGWRLAHSEFKEHSSTHGQQFWIIPELGLKRKDGTECEAVLWDLAGQPDYRLIHSLYLDDVDTAMVLFDPTNRQEPLAGVDFWLNQLKRKDKDLCNTILVGARTDRGTSTLTDKEIQAYCERNGICGGYIPTSAKENVGLEQLMKTLKAQIPWDGMTATVTTVTFKRIKEFVLALKEQPERKSVLIKPSELHEQLQDSDPDWKFSDSEMTTAVGHLETHGYIKWLHGSNGERTILLAPDVLVNLASSIILEARRNPRGLGVLEEARLLRREYLFPELTNLSEGESKILLDAAAVLFLEHHLCFRETFNEQIFLVFPSLINEKRPIDESIKIIEGETYQVKGAVENLYASMVVLLGYTNTFIRTHQWQNQAQYEMGKGEVCGFQQITYEDGSIELVLHYGEQTPEPVRLMFRGLFERFLSLRELEIARYQTVICKNCSTLLARSVVLDQINKNKKFTFCHECGRKVALPSPEPLTRPSPKEEVEIDTQQSIANYRTAFEAALVRVKGLLRDQRREKAPTCFISYAWGVPEHEKWVVQLAKDLRNAGIDVLLDRWHSPPGSDLVRYTDQIVKSDFVAVVGTPQLLTKYETQATDPVVAAELRLINLRLREPSVYGQTVIPLLLDGDVRSSFTPLLQTLVRVDFKQSAFYFRQLFDTIWQIYSLPRDNPLLDELLDSMAPQENP